MCFSVTVTEIMVELVKRADSVERVPLPLKDDTGEIEDEADIQGELL